MQALQRKNHHEEHQLDLLGIAVPSDRSHPLFKPLYYHFSNPGKMVRYRLAAADAAKFSITQSKITNLAAVPELLHNASLIHDDLQDQDKDRRGSKSLWSRFGADVAICAGDYLVSLAYRSLAEAGVDPTRAFKLTNELIERVIEGQLIDLAQEKDQSLSDFQTYRNLSKKKTGPLFAMTFLLPALNLDNAPPTSEVTKIFDDFALAYQIIDDVHDVVRDRSKKGSISGVNVVTVLTNGGKTDGKRHALEIARSCIRRVYAAVSAYPFLSTSEMLHELGALEKSILDQSNPGVVK